MNTAGGTSTTCQDCGKVFSEANAFMRHFRQYHKKSESDCHICERKFYTEFLLKHHIGLQHTNANCEICDKVVLKSSLNAHKKTHQENAFKCESCDKVYNRKNNLENHRKTCGRLVRVLRKAGKECVERTEEYWLQNWVYALFLLATLCTSWEKNLTL